MFGNEGNFLCSKDLPSRKRQKAMCDNDRDREVLGVHMPTLKKFMHTASSQDIIKWASGPNGRLLCITIEDTGENK